MINIRKGTFETNSSSTHSIVITKGSEKIDIPEKISIDLSDYGFGWEYDTYNSPEEKIAYLIFGLTTETYYDNLLEATKRLDVLVKTITKWVKDVEIKGLKFTVYNGHPYFEVEDGYVDHASDMKELIDAVLENEELLKRYLFSTDSFIATGNDNEDGYPEIRVNYEYDEFYKGN